MALSSLFHTDRRWRTLKVICCISCLGKGYLTCCDGRHAGLERPKRKGPKAGGPHLEPFNAMGVLEGVGLRP